MVTTRRPPAGATVAVPQHGSPTGDSLLVGWVRVGAAGGFVAGLSYAVAAAAPVTSGLALVAAFVFGPALVCFSTGLYHVLRAHRRAITLDLGLMANVAAGVTVTLMFSTQLTLYRWFDLQFGSGASDSSDRALRAGFEAANGIQLGLDVAWDVFLALGTGLFVWNMRRHPRFGRLLAVSGGVIALALTVTNLTLFPEPPGHAGSIDFGPVIGVWYVIVTVRLAMASRWAAARAAPLPEPERSS